MQKSVKILQQEALKIADKAEQIFSKIYPSDKGVNRLLVEAGAYPDNRELSKAILNAKSLIELPYGDVWYQKKEILKVQLNTEIKKITSHAYEMMAQKEASFSRIKNIAWDAMLSFEHALLACIEIPYEHESDVSDYVLEQVGVSRSFFSDIEGEEITAYTSKWGQYESTSGTARVRDKIQTIEGVYPSGKKFSLQGQFTTDLKKVFFLMGEDIDMFGRTYPIEIVAVWEK